MPSKPRTLAGILRRRRHADREYNRARRDPAVARIAAAMGYDTCAHWVRDHRALYARGIFHGFDADGGREGQP